MEFLVTLWLPILVGTIVLFFLSFLFWAVLPHHFGDHDMAVNMSKTILYFAVTVSTIAYITHVACPPGSEGVDFMRVFRMSGTIGILTYATSNVLHRVWFKKRVWTEIVDGIVYGLVLGLIFASFWGY